MIKGESIVINGATAFTLNQAAKLLNFEIGRTKLMTSLWMTIPLALLAAGAGWGLERGLRHQRQ